jgi:hypothetical protein
VVQPPSEIPSQSRNSTSEVMLGTGDRCDLKDHEAVKVATMQVRQTISSGSCSSKSISISNSSSSSSSCGSNSSSNSCSRSSSRRSSSRSSSYIYSNCSNSSSSISSISSSSISCGNCSSISSSEGLEVLPATVGCGEIQDRDAV